MTKPRVFIFDLDGTLALVDHRRHHVEGADTPDWDAFFDACVDDDLNLPVAQMFYALQDAGHLCWIFSGRSKRVERATRKWLSDNGLTPYRLFMREEGDFTPDEQLKSQWLTDVLTENPWDIACVLDDRDKVVQMWRDRGIPCFQVAPGAF